MNLATFKVLRFRDGEVQVQVTTGRDARIFWIKPGETIELYERAETLDVEQNQVYNALVDRLRHGKA